LGKSYRKFDRPQWGVPESTAERTLGLRELNRTTLRRQLLLQRSDVSAVKAIERLVGVQAQLARPPFVGLWSRLDRFDRAELTKAIEQRTVVKATLLRGTLHLLTARDYLSFRATFQATLSNALDDVLKAKGAHVDVPRLVDAARDFMHAAPRSFAEITTLLTGLEPDGDPGAMRYAVRTHLPMIQVPIDTAWGYPGNPRFALAEDWLDIPVPTTDGQHAELVKRYLAAFGPATVKDVETWSYLPSLQPAFDTLAPELVRYRDERGRTLFDLPGLPIEPEDAPAPLRFLPEFDNLLLAHQDRTRVVPKAARGKVFLPGLRVAATVLVDGFVAATWTTERVKQAVTLTVAPLAPVNAAVQAELMAEGDRLVRFVEPDARTYDVRIAD
jgi:hypothetical protein